LIVAACAADAVQAINSETNKIGSAVHNAALFCREGAVHNAALSLGERVSRDGVFTSRRGTGEGSVWPIRDLQFVICDCVEGRKHDILNWNAQKSRRPAKNSGLRYPMVVALVDIYRIYII